MTEENTPAAPQDDNRYAIEPSYIVDKLLASGLAREEVDATLVRMATGDEQAIQAVMSAADLVSTIRGLVPREKLVVTQHQDETPNAFECATEFYLEGELVRRDAWVNMKRGLSMGAAQAQIA